MTDLIPKLKDAAERATPERIGGDRPAVNPGPCECQLCASEFIGEPLHVICEGCDAREAFQRVASPANVMTLIDRVERCEAVLRRSLSLLDSYGDVDREDDAEFVAVREAVREALESQP